MLRISLTAALFPLMTLLAADSAPLKPPIAKVVPKKITAMGQTRVDNYFWLRDRGDPDVLKYLEAENKYTEAVMSPTVKLQEKLYREILGRIKQTDLSVPVREGDYSYYTRTEEGKQYQIWCRKLKNLGAAEEILIDGNKLAEGHKYFRLANFRVSPNHKLLAFATDTVGEETYTTYFKDLATGALLADQIPGVYYSFAWSVDNKTVFYTTQDHAKRPYKVRRHVLGAKLSDDAEVFHEPDEKFTVAVGETKNRQYVLIGSNSSTTSEIRFVRSAQPASPFRIIEPRRPQVEYDVAQHGADFYIRVNDTGKNFRLVKAPAARPSKDNWKEVLAHRDGVMLEFVDAFRDHLVLVERENGLRKLQIRNLKSGQVHAVGFPEPVYTVFPSGNPDFESRLLRFNYTSLVTPSSVFDYDMDDKTRELKKQTEVLGGYDPSRYTSERIYATAPDGVKVPISLVYKKGLVKNGKAPMMLYGYGSYGSNSEPTFRSNRLSLLDRGFIYGIAHIRGGGDLGKAWHDDGKMLKKKNTFSDFIASAEHLVADRYTSPPRLAVYGGSAGGLLLGAVLNMRPDLFGAAIAKVPFVDVLNTAQDATLPLTVGEYEEWGNSNQEPFFDYIQSYSPYDNVKAQKYPHLLVTAGLNDPRVSYWEPAKWTAKLRVMKTGDNLLLLKTNLGAGHFGASGRYDAIKETSFDYAFLLNTFGILE